MHIPPIPASHDGWKRVEHMKISCSYLKISKILQGNVCNTPNSEVLLRAIIIDVFYL